ncbi:MAG: hypothetical protein ACE5QF_09960 [Thermoplasmata archaeon]
MEAKNDWGELIYEETPAAISDKRREIITIIAASVTGWILWMFLDILFDLSKNAFALGAFLLIVVLLPAAIGIHSLRRIRPLRIYEKGLTTRYGAFHSFERLRRAVVGVCRPPAGAWVAFGHSLRKGPFVRLHLTQDEVDAQRLIELVRTLDDLGLVVCAAKHAKAEDDGVVAIGTGNVLLEEPPETFGAFKKRTRIIGQAIVLPPLIFAVVVVVYMDLDADGMIGEITTIIGSLVLGISILVAVTVFFAVPPSGWTFYERGLRLHTLMDTHPYYRYEDCAYAVLHKYRLLGTKFLRVHLEGFGYAGDIPVGEKKHAYGDVDRLVELLESKGVPVER